jgi:hypothetical protein
VGGGREVSTAKRAITPSVARLGAKQIWDCHQKSLFANESFRAVNIYGATTLSGVEGLFSALLRESGPVGTLGWGVGMFAVKLNRAFTHSAAPLGDYS